jgi:hypothetical protein
MNSKKERTVDGAKKEKGGTIEGRETIRCSKFRYSV